MVISTIRIEAKSNSSLKTLEILRSVQGPTLAQPGCQGCQIFEEDGPDQAIVLCEEWSSPTAFHEHVRSDMYRRVLAALELASHPPEVCVHHVSTTEGMELIQQLRTGIESANSSNS